MNRSDVFSRLRDQGVARVEVQFSGGNDEGSVEDIVLLDAKGKELRRMQECCPKYNPETETFETLTDIEQLSQALSEPVYDKYGSFAGEFYVSGTVTWDVAAGKVSIEGSESVEHFESFDDEV